MNKDKLLILEKYVEENKENKNKIKIKYHLLNTPERNPIFNFYFKKQQIRHYEDEKYNFMYQSPFIEEWFLGKKPKRMNNRVYYSHHLENFVKFGVIPDKFINRDCPVCLNRIKRDEDHFINSLCNHPVCIYCFQKLKKLNPEYYGECKECPLCKGELRTWTQCTNLFNKKYLNPDERPRFKGKNLIFLNDDDLKRYIMFYNTFIKNNINEKGEYYDYDYKDFDKEKKDKYNEKCEEEFKEMLDEYLENNKIIKKKYILKKNVVSIII